MVEELSGHYRLTAALMPSIYGGPQLRQILSGEHAICNADQRLATVV
jgi:hypothetical protein